MTREEAIIHIETLRTVTKDIPKYCGKAIDEALDMAIEALEQRWIPVSERLPELNQNVIVTYNKEYEFRVDISYYSKHGFWIGNVVAWMPLPEPYKAESEEENGTKD